LDGTYEEYGTGKAFHIYRPSVWDAAGDTEWGFIQIDTTLGSMTIGVDSTWMANAVYPVIIDPSIGNTTIGASRSTLVDYRHEVLWATTHSPSADGTIDSARIHSGVFATDEADNYAMVTLWERTGSTVDSTAFVASSDSIDVQDGTTDPHWVNLAMTGSVSSTKTYIVSIAGTNNTAFNHRPSFDTFVSWGDSKLLTDTDFIAPSDLTGAASDNNNFTVAVWYTEGGGGGSTPSRRRRGRMEEDK
jgi:hypothetical protein